MNEPSISPEQFPSAGDAFGTSFNEEDNDVPF